MKKTLLLSVLLFFTASLILAEETKAPEPDKVLKVYIMKAKKLGGQAGPGIASFDIDNVEFVSPSDAELEAAEKAIEETGVKPGDLKEDQVLPLQFFVLEVKKAYKDQPEGKLKTANGIRVEKPTEEDLDNQQKLIDLIKNLRNFFKNFEFQVGLGGTFAASPALYNAYQPGFNYNFGLGYQFSEVFDLLMVLEGSRYVSNNDSLTGGYEFSDISGEFLLKLRLPSKGLRPYLFAGVGGSTGSFDIDYTYNNLSEHRTYRDTGHFTMLGGLGLEIPLWPKVHLYAQGGMAYDFLKDETVNFVPLDQPIRFVPVSVGFVFGN
jgi:opacity protein-like surface antigen